MISSSNLRSITWQSLSELEKIQGVHPFKLGRMKFEFQRHELKDDLLRDIHQFLMASRIATTKSDFTFRARQVLQPKNKNLQPIKEIVKKVLKTPVAKGRLLDEEMEDYSPIPLKREVRDQFISVHNELIRRDKSFLMHPARRYELIEYLSERVSKPELAADRLITFHCYGILALKVVELERELIDYLRQQALVKEEISHLLQKAPKPILDPNSLKAIDLSCIEVEVIRNYVHRIYQHLAGKNKLDILERPKEQLYSAPFKIDSNLTQCYWEFNKETAGCYMHFGIVIDYVKTLRHSDLADLELFCLNEKLAELQTDINVWKKHKLEETKKTYQNTLNFVGKTPESFKPGDFSFVTDPSTFCAVRDTYKAVSKLNEWPFFDQEPPETKGYIFWDHPTIKLIAKELHGSGHSGASAGITMRWMQRIRQKGWETVARENLELNLKDLGVLNRIKRLT